MDITNLKGNSHKLIEYMINAGYKDSGYNTLYYVRKWIDLALSSDNAGIHSFEDLYSAVIKESKPELSNGFTLRLRRSLEIVRLFDRYGILPTRRKFLSEQDDVSIKALTPVFGKIVSYYMENEDRTGRRPATIRCEFKSLIRFFTHLQSQGAYGIDDITEKMVNTYFHNGEKQLRGRTCCSILTAGLRNVRDKYKDIADRLIDLLPSIPRKYKLFDYLTKEEAGRILESLMDDGSGLSYRDRAIGLMSYFWGIRGTDIISLKFKDINWVEDKIEITQSKTGYPLTLPINAAIGNALFDYINSERPKCGLDEIFVSASAPYSRLRDVYHPLANVFASAGVRIGKGKKGTRTMRHNLVTGLLGKGMECQTVTAIAGHERPESLLPYVDTDSEKLRDCSISIVDYPIRESVLDPNDIFLVRNKAPKKARCYPRKKKEPVDVPISILIEFAISIEDYPIKLEFDKWERRSLDHS